jgi:hypothetical protein
MTSNAALAVLAHARKDLRSVAEELIRMATVANVAGDHRFRDLCVSQAETLIRVAADACLQRYSVYAVAGFTM